MDIGGHRLYAVLIEKKGHRVYAVLIEKKDSVCVSVCGH